MTKPVTAPIDPAWRRQEPLCFWCAGKPEPKGSARAFVLPTKVPGQKPRAIVTSTNTNVKAWEKAINVEAKRSLGGMVFVDPVAVTIGFVLPRPQALKGHNVWHTTRPDIDKLARAVLDGLTGAAYADDGLVVALEVRKRYANAGGDPGADVDVRLVAGYEIQPEMI